MQQKKLVEARRKPLEEKFAKAMGELNMFAGEADTSISAKLNDGKLRGDTQATLLRLLDHLEALKLTVTYVGRQYREAEKEKKPEEKAKRLQMIAQNLAFLENSLMGPISLMLTMSADTTSSEKKLEQKFERIASVAAELRELCGVFSPHNAEPHLASIGSPFWSQDIENIGNKNNERISDVTLRYRPTAKMIADSLFDGIERLYYEKNPHLSQQEKELIRDEIKRLKKDGILLGEGAIEFYFKRFDEVKHSAAMNGARSEYEKIKEKIFNGEIPADAKSIKKDGMDVFAGAGVEEWEIDALLRGIAHVNKQLPLNKKINRLVAVRLSEGNSVDVINAFFDPEQNRILVFFGGKKAGNEICENVAFHEAAHGYYHNGVNGEKKLRAVVQAYAQLMLKYRQGELYETIRKADKLDLPTYFFENTPLKYGSTAGEIHPIARLFDESNYPELIDRGGHPYDNSDELFASASSILKYAPSGFFAGVEKLKGEDPESAGLALQIARAIIEAWGDERIFPKSVYKKLGLE